MAALHVTKKARADLLEIWRYIAENDPVAADRVLDLLDETSRKLLAHPELGPARDDIRPGLRYVIVEPYLMLYRILETDIEIVRVVHGRRDLFALF
ncbi:type II toxin-antitoxin system RelE/ParE family toxin [Tepidicaulis sp. LMO-SS28]|uniref:type II toxin-antitoxin system RelE/ParE family toxin n=1 Tax=Tepidicaulis sp. LMO-SS28 TaxID=3447455 RepID=UPI003EE325F1